MQQPRRSLGHGHQAEAVTKALLAQHAPRPPARSSPIQRPGMPRPASAKAIRLGMDMQIRGYTLCIRHITCTIFSAPIPHRGTIHEESYQNRKMASKTSKTAPQGVPPSPRRLSGALWFAITAAREKMGQLEAE